MQHPISAIALEKMDGILFKSMLQLVQWQLNAEWTFSESAQIVLVDIEQPEGKSFWQDHSHDTTILMIAYARQNEQRAQWFLPKPIRVQTLVQLLNAITVFKVSVPTATIPPPVDVVSTTPTVTDEPMEKTAVIPIENKVTVMPVEKNTVHSVTLPNECFEPAQYLLGLLQTTLQSNQAKRFNCGSLPPLYVLPSERRCFIAPINMGQVDIEQRMLYAALAEQVKSVNLSVEALRIEVEKNKLRAYPAETLLWLAALHASHGRLLTGYKKEAGVRLKQWPNFIILPHYSVHINLAAFMLKHTTDIFTIAGKTRLSLSTVIDFVNACKVIGLIVEGRNPEATTERAIPDPKRNLLKNILKRLLQ